jgi:hypothetical protein
VQVSATLRMAVVRLQGDLALQQRLDLGVATARLAAMALAVATVHVDAALAIGVNVLAAAFMLRQLQHDLVRRVGTARPADGTYRAELWQLVRRQTPNSLYYCASAQIGLWLVGHFGGVDRVAEVGALGRLAVLFTVLGTIVSAFVQPAFARAGDLRLVRGWFLRLNAGFALLTAALTAAAAAWPQGLLWLLGAAYAGLTAELPWLVCGAALAAWSAAVYSASAARGWIVPATWLIPTGIAVTAFCAVGLDMSTVAGALLMNVATTGAALAISIAAVALRLAGAAR